MEHGYWAEFLELALIHFIAVIVKGTDFAVTVRQSVRFGKRVGIATAIGICAGISVHVVYTLLGVGALMHTTPWLLSAAKWVGGAYILYLGIKFLGSKPATLSSDSGVAPVIEHGPSLSRAFLTGFTTNATNPKATLFFLAIFTTIVSAQTPLKIQLLFGLWMCCVNALWFVVVSVLFSRPSVRQHFLRMGHWFERVMGLILMAFALRLLFL